MVIQISSFFSLKKNFKLVNKIILIFLTYDKQYNLEIGSLSSKDLNNTKSIYCECKL